MLDQSAGKLGNKRKEFLEQYSNLQIRKCLTMDGSVDRDTPEELSYSPIVVTVYFIWGVVFLLLVIALCVVGLVPLANNHRYGKLILTNIGVLLYVGLSELEVILVRLILQK